jgi:hypothetical protein
MATGAVALGMIGFGAAARADEATASTARYYKIELRLVQYDSEGKRKVVTSTDAMVVQEGRAGTFFDGQEIAIPGEGKGIDYMEVGASLRMLVHGMKGGKVSLDATAQYSWLEPAPKPTLRVRSVGGRSVEAVRLGEHIQVELADGSDAGASRVFEVTVQEVENRSP